MREEVKEVRRIGIAGIQLVPESWPLAHLDVACRKRRLARPRWPGNPNDRRNGVVDAREQALPVDHAMDARRRDLGAVARHARRHDSPPSMHERIYAARRTAARRTRCPFVRRCAPLPPGGDRLGRPCGSRAALQPHHAIRPQRLPQVRDRGHEAQRRLEAQPARALQQLDAGDLDRLAGGGHDDDVAARAFGQRERASLERGARPGPGCRGCRGCASAGWRRARRARSGAPGSCSRTAACRACRCAPSRRSRRPG